MFLATNATAQSNNPHSNWPHSSMHQASQLNEQLHCQPEHNYLQTIEQEIIQVVI